VPDGKDKGLVTIGVQSFAKRRGCLEAVPIQVEGERPQSEQLFRQCFRHARRVERFPTCQVFALRHLLARGAATSPCAEKQKAGAAPFQVLRPALRQSRERTAICSASGALMSSPRLASNLDQAALLSTGWRKLLGESIDWLLKEHEKVTLPAMPQLMISPFRKSFVEVAASTPAAPVVLNFRASP
jgi:hypothetical protein